MLQKNILALLCILGITGQSAIAQNVGFIVRPNSSSILHPVSGQTWWANSSNRTLNVWNGTAYDIASAPKNNFVATTNPTTSNDNTQGYSPGSQWYNVNNSNIYSLVDATTNAAVWVQTNNLGSLSIPLTAIQQGAAATGQALIWNGSQWSPSTQNISLNNLLQTGALTGQVPVWNGTSWIAASLSGAGGASATPTFATIANETASLPNSSRLVAGSNITLTPGTNTLTISAAGSSGAPTTLTYLTQADESGTLPNSLILAVASGLTLSSSTGPPNLQTIGFTTGGGPTNNKVFGYVSGSPMWTFAFTGLQASAYTSNTISVGNTGPSYRRIDTTGGAVALTLVQASSIGGGMILYLNNWAGSNNVTISAHSGDSIDGGSITLTPGQICAIISDSGLNSWHLVQKPN